MSEKKRRTFVFELELDEEKMPGVDCGAVAYALLEAAKTMAHTNMGEDTFFTGDPYLEEWMNSENHIFARLRVVPVPFDSQTHFKPGAKKHQYLGPAAAKGSRH